MHPSTDDPEPHILHCLQIRSLCVDKERREKSDIPCGSGSTQRRQQGHPLAQRIFHKAFQIRNLKGLQIGTHVRDPVICLGFSVGERLRANMIRGNRAESLREETLPGEDLRIHPRGLLVMKTKSQMEPLGGFRMSSRRPSRRKIFLSETLRPYCP